MKLISDLLQEPLSILTESVDGKKRLYIEGIYAQSEKDNRNKRKYPKSVMEKAVNKYITEKVNTRQAVGELNHPPRLQVDYERATHRITEMKWDGNDVIGKALILTSTPMGKLVEGLLEGGVNLGVSTRGAGSIKESVGGISIVGDDFFLTAVDVVSDPSAYDAWVNGIMEGVEYTLCEDGKIIEVDTKAALIEAYNKKKLNEEAKLKAFQNFITKIKGL